MTLRSAAFLFPLGFCLMAQGALAAPGTWSLRSDKGGCEVSLLAEEVDDGIFFVDRGEAECGDDVARITGYALNEDGAVVVFYSTLAGVEIVGQVRKDAEGAYSGKTRGGAALLFEHLGGDKTLPDPAAGRADLETAEATPPEPDSGASAEPPAPQVQSCDLTLAGRDTCAEADDLGAPASGQLQVLSRMNMRDSGSTEGSTVIGRVEAGACLTAGFCSEDGQGRLWCGVTSDSASGFILKQDATTVYALNSCE